MSNNKTVEQLRKDILVEFKNVLRLAPADYTENCTNVVMSMVEKLLAQERAKADKQAIHTLSTLGWISKKLDEHAKSIGLWDMKALALQTVVGSGEANTEQIREWNDMVTERRAIMLIQGLMKQAKHEMNPSTELKAKELESNE